MASSDLPGMTLPSGGVPQRVRIDAAGRVVIPVEVRRALGIKKGQELALSLVEDRITLSTLERARARVKALARAHRKDDGSVVDAFLAARRVDAAGEPSPEEREVAGLTQERASGGERPAGVSPLPRARLAKFQQSGRRLHRS